jgi:hypothetical protein
MPTVCNRCRGPIVSEPSTIRPVSGPLARRHREIDLCVDCSDRFEDWLRHGELAEALGRAMAGPAPLPQDLESFRP